jgi:hypothetical protein
MSVKALKGSGSCDRAISERKTATSVVGKDGQRSWLRLISLSDLERG